MIRVNNCTYFTKEDINNVVYRKYSQVEVEERRRQLKKKRNKKRMIYMVALCLLIAATRVKELEYIAGVTISLVVFFFILEEIVNRLNTKSDASPYYIEIQVEQKLPREYDYTYDSTSGVMQEDFCPIKGHDTTSGYQSVFYIDWKKYLDVEVGSKLIIEMPDDCEDMPSPSEHKKRKEKETIL